MLYAPTLLESFVKIDASTVNMWRWKAPRWVVRMDVATAWQTGDGWLEAIVLRCERRERWRVLRWVREARRAVSGGERREVGEGLVVEVRSGEGWPERERRISWSMVGDFVYVMD